MTTPRTDASIAGAHDQYGPDLIDFARQLETELNAANERERSVTDLKPQEMGKTLSWLHSHGAH